MNRNGPGTRKRARKRESLSVVEAYALLGLSPLADRDVVHATYRRLVLRYHPDKGGGNIERFKELAGAYRVLQNKFHLEQIDSDQAHGECDHCGEYDVLRQSPDGSHCCPSCLARAGRRRLLPAPPVVIASCATTIVLLCLAAGCVLASCASHAPHYSLAAAGLGVAALVSLAVTCLTVVYTAEPTRRRRHRSRR
jgi:hypothetical protein